MTKALDTKSVDIPNSFTDARNGLLVCDQCNGLFEDHSIDIDGEGVIQVNAKRLASHGDLEKVQKYTALNGTLVPWSARIGGGLFPSQELLEWRLTLPPVSSPEGKQLIKDFNAAWKKGFSRSPEDDDDELAAQNKKVSR
jgi:hypothetical protein